jgi:hypothetical protein
MGLMAAEKTLRGLPTHRETSSDLWTARVFGVISPKTRIRKVIARVDRTMAPSSLIKVEMMFSPRLAAAMLTNVFPRRRVARTRTGFSIIFEMSLFWGSLLFLNSLSLPWPRLKRAVSDPEKNPDRMRRIKREIVLKINWKSQNPENFYVIVYQFISLCQLRPWAFKSREDRKGSQFS